MIDIFKFQKLQPQQILHLHPFVLMVALDMVLYVNANGYSTLLTSIIRTPDESKKLGSVSDTHEQGRAFDLRVRGWTKEFQEQFEKYFEHKYKGHGAVSSKTLRENLVDFHGEGENYHAHIQFNNDYGDPTAWLKI